MVVSPGWTRDDIATSSKPVMATSSGDLETPAERADQQAERGFVVGADDRARRMLGVEQLTGRDHAVGLLQPDPHGCFRARDLRLTMAQFEGFPAFGDVGRAVGIADERKPPVTVVAQQMRGQLCHPGVVTANRRDAVERLPGEHHDRYYGASCRNVSALIVPPWTAMPSTRADIASTSSSAAGRRCVPMMWTLAPASIASYSKPWITSEK